MAFDGEQFGNFIVEQVRNYVERATAPLLKRIADLEVRNTFDLEAVMAELRERGFATVDSHVSAVDFEALKQRWAERDEAFDAATARIREFGERLEALSGIDVATFTAELEAKALEMAENGARRAVEIVLDARPAPRDGVDGLDAPEVTPDQIDASVARYLEANPPAPGKDGIDGKDGRDGIDGQKGTDGADGVGLASALIDKDGHLIVTTTRGAVIGLGEVVGRDGVNGERGEKGEPGRDGFSLTDFDSSLDEDGRILTLSLESGDLKVTHELELGGMIDRGVFREGQEYVKGDAVTWGGSLYIANAKTTQKPDTSEHWRLAARRGRDGKAGRPGKDGERGPQGLPGKDGKAW